MATNEQRLKPRQVGKSGHRCCGFRYRLFENCLFDWPRRSRQPRPDFLSWAAGRQQSRGFNGGAITDIEALERSIRLAVEDAEREAGERIDRVILGITGPKVDSQLAEAENRNSGNARLAEKTCKRSGRRRSGRRSLKTANCWAHIRSCMAWDDQDDIRDAVGMIGERLRVLLNVVTAPKSLVNNLKECVQRAHLGVERIVPSALASGSGTLIEDEIDNGAICIDFWRRRDIGFGVHERRTGLVGFGQGRWLACHRRHRARDRDDVCSGRAPENTARDCGFGGPWHG